MEKVDFLKDKQNQIESNFHELEQFFNIEYKVFFDLNSTIFEITNCLIFDLNKAAITLTNNFLERLLKLALVYNEVGIKPIPFEHWGAIFNKTEAQFGSINMSKSIELCEKYNLLDSDEKDYLFDTVRVLMRNGFSHADASKTLKNHPDSIIGFKGSLTNEFSPHQMELNQKTIPPLQTVQIEKFAKENAKSYFKKIVSIMSNIETRLDSK